MNSAETPRQAAESGDETVRLSRSATFPLPPPPPPPGPTETRPGPPLSPGATVAAPASPAVPTAPTRPVSTASPGSATAAAPVGTPPSSTASSSSTAPPSAPQPAATPPSGDKPRRGRLGLLAVAVVSALVGALTAVGATALTDDDGGDRIVARPAVETPEGVLDIQTILDRVGPSVVTLETSVSARGGVFAGAGTGVVLSADGLIMTNAHVVAQSEDITVRMFDGEQHDAVLVGSEPSNDIAIIRVEGVDDLTPAELGDSESLLVGDPVIAIGNALNLGAEPSVTTGIVSAVNRSIESPEGNLSDLIQTDAAINPGNSGGPLVDASGAVVGINTAIIDGSQNIGFAIAIDAAKPILERIQNGESEITPDTPRLGVTTVPLDTVEESVRERLDIQAEEGAYVWDVTPGSGADEAGIEQGDVIVRMDGQDITANEQLGEIVTGHEPGDSIEIVIERDGEQQTLTAVIGRQGG